MPTEIRPAHAGVPQRCESWLLYEGHECTPSLTGGEEREASTAEEGPLARHNTTAYRRNS